MANNPEEKTKKPDIFKSNLSEFTSIDGLSLKEVLVIVRHDEWFLNNIGKRLQFFAKFEFSEGGRSISTTNVVVIKPIVPHPSYIPLAKYPTIYYNVIDITVEDFTKNIVPEEIVYEKLKAFLLSVYRNNRPFKVMKMLVVEKHITLEELTKFIAPEKIDIDIDIDHIGIARTFLYHVCWIFASGGMGIPYVYENPFVKMELEINKNFFIPSHAYSITLESLKEPCKTFMTAVMNVMKNHQTCQTMLSSLKMDSNRTEAYLKTIMGEIDHV